MIIMQNYTKLPRFSRFILLPAVCNIEITPRNRRHGHRRRRRSHTSTVLHRACTPSVIIGLPVAPFQNGGLSNSLCATQWRSFSGLQIARRNNFLPAARRVRERPIVRRYYLSPVAREIAHTCVHAR